MKGSHNEVESTVLDQCGSLFWMPVWLAEFDGRTDVQPMESFPALPQTVEVMQAE
jgi:hypothetical protein